MSRYLLLYKADQTAEQQMAQASPEQAQAGLDVWMAWKDRVGDAIVDMGSPVASASESADPRIGGYSVVEADDSQALQAILKDHPHLQVGTIDVHEFLALPGM